MKYPFLTLSNLSVGYHRKAILQNLDLSATNAELIALIGRNGIGKSTLMRTIARLQPAISGEVLIAGKPIGQYSRNELAGLLSIVSTESVGISHLSVRQLVAFGRFPYTNWIGKLTDQDALLLQEAMQLVGITHLADKKLHEISDGERQRAMIARTLAQDTNIILLDEPTAFLDMPNKYEVVGLLQRLTRKKRKTIIFSTHDLNIAMQVADKLWLMVADTLYEGTPEDLVLNGKLARLFEGSKLSFDEMKGEFKINQNNNLPIRLSGEGKIHFWTKKALERLGFSVHNSSGKYSITILENTAQIVWVVSNNDEQVTFDSIYNMTQYLLKNN